MSCGVAMDFTRVLQFLTERNLENLHDVFKVKKIDDNVAPNLTLKQLGSLGLVMGDAIAFTKEFGNISQEELSFPTTYADRVNQLKNKIKAKHSQVVSSNASNPNRFYNVTISLKTRENQKSNNNQVKFTFVRKSKRSTVLHVSGDCLFTDMLSKARDNFRVNKVTECYLATSKGEILSTRGKKLITFINLNKSTKKRPQIYLHYLNTYAHFLWHGEVMQYLDNEDDHDNDADIGSPQLQQQDQGDRSDHLEFSNLSESGRDTESEDDDFLFAESNKRPVPEELDVRRPKRNARAPRKYRLSIGETTLNENNLPELDHIELPPPVTERLTSTSSFMSEVQRLSTPLSANPAQRIDLSTSVAAFPSRVSAGGNQYLSAPLSLSAPPAPKIDLSTMAAAFVSSVSAGSNHHQSTPLSTPPVPRMDISSSASASAPGVSAVGNEHLTKSSPQAPRMNLSSSVSIPVPGVSADGNRHILTPLPAPPLSSVSASARGGWLEERIQDTFKCFICCCYPDDSIAFCTKCYRYLGCYSCLATLEKCPNCVRKFAVQCTECNNDLFTFVQEVRVPGLGELFLY